MYDEEGREYPSSSYQDTVKNLGPRIKILGPAIVLIIVLIWVASGFYSVGPGEQGVVRQFGRYAYRTGPGLRYRFPWPVQAHNIVDVATVRRSEIGFRSHLDDDRTLPEEALMLTGDENILKVHLMVQYVVRDPDDYLFRVRDPINTLHSTAEVVLRSVVGANTIDHTMTEGRVEVQRDVAEQLQELLDYYRTGLLVVDVRLLEVDPPDQVKDKFHEVVRAWEDRERLVQEAEGYREDLLPRARGEAQAVIRQAEGYKEQRVLEAQGHASRFLQILAEYQQAEAVTRERLYLETMMRALRDVKKYVIDQDVGSGLLQVLPLTDRVEGVMQ